MPLSRDDLIYLAGFVDGEGCVSLAWRKVRGKNYITPNIQITNTNKEIIEWIASEIPGHIHERKEKRVNRKDSWCYQISGNKALELIKDIYPYLKVKRQQADVVMGINRIKVGRGLDGRLVRTITPEIDKQNLDAVMLIRSLNQRGKIYA